MIHLITPKYKIKTTNTEPIKNKISVAIFGVFNNPESSNILLSKAFKNNENIISVKNIDYRDYNRRNKDYFKDLIKDVSKIHDLIFICKGNKLSPDLIQYISEPTKIFLWYMDWWPNLLNSPEVLQYSKMCHYRSATGFETSGLWACNSGIPTYNILDGSDTDNYFPINYKKEYDVIFIGGCDDERTIIYKFLSNQGYKVKFFGPGFTSYVNRSEFIELCNKSKIVLNMSRSNYIGYTSLRLWNIMACQSFVLTKHIPYMTKLMGLVPGVHLDEFSNVLELRTKIHKYLKEESLRETIAKNARTFILNNRTWGHSVKDVLHTITNDYGIVEYKPQYQIKNTQTIVKSFKTKRIGKNYGVDRN